MLAASFISLQVLQRIWSHHASTNFFSPYPSPADKWVLSIFARDFEHCSSAAAAILPESSPHIPLKNAPSIPTFDTVLDCTRRLCRQVPAVLSLLRAPFPPPLLALSKSDSPSFRAGAVSRCLYACVQPAKSSARASLAALPHSQHQKPCRPQHCHCLEWRVRTKRMGRRICSTARGALGFT